MLVSDSLVYYGLEAVTKKDRVRHENLAKKS